MVFSIGVRLPHGEVPESLDPGLSRCTDSSWAGRARAETPARRGRGAGDERKDPGRPRQGRGPEADLHRTDRLEEELAKKEVLQSLF